MDGRLLDGLVDTLRMLRVVLLVLLLALFDPPRAWAGNRFHERNHTGLLVLYGFDDGQMSSDLHPTSARDYTGRGLLGNLTTSTTAIDWMENRVGFSVPTQNGGFRATSQLSSTQLLSELVDEFSIELFMISPTNNALDEAFIVGMGQWQPGVQFPRCVRSGSSTEGGWRVFSSIGNGILMQVVLMAGGVPQCVEFGFGNTPNSIRHVIFRGRPGQVSYYSDGGSGGSSGVSFVPSLWAQNASPLTFAIPHPASGWTGTMLMFAMHNRYISNVEAQLNNDLGLPNSLPIASVSAIGITEDLTSTLYP